MHSTRRRGRKRVDPGETAQERFKRLATKRLDKALLSLRLLQNLSRRAQYEYSEQQADWIVRSLSEGLDDVRTSFERGNPGANDFEQDVDKRLYARRPDSGRFRDTRTPRQRLLDRNKQAGRYWPRRQGPGPR
jgi:hypothetical protein